MGRWQGFVVSGWALSSVSVRVGWPLVGGWVGEWVSDLPHIMPQKTHPVPQKNKTKQKNTSTTRPETCPQNTNPTTQTKLGPTLLKKNEKKNQLIPLIPTYY